MNGTVLTVGEQFREAMAESRIVCDDDIVADGRMQRFRVEGDKPHKQSGWYVLHSNGNGMAAGAFGSWKTDQKETWCSRIPEHITAAERQAVTRHMQQAKEQLKQEIDARRIEVAREAQAVWDTLPEASPDHPYLQRKKIHPHGIRQHQDHLVIPLRDISGELKSLQTIKPDQKGTKRFLPGGAKLSNFYVIGELQDVIYIGEGFATMATVHASTGHGAAVAFDAGNLRSVAEVIRNKYPHATIVIVADDDQWTDGNPGVTKATAAAKAIHAKLVIPQFANLETKPTDFNDLSCLEGLDTVKTQLTEALSMDGEEQPCAESPGEAIARLAALPSLEYGQQRKSASEDLDVPLKFLDQAVTEARAARGTNKKPGQGSEITFDEIFPSEELVDGAELVESLRTTIERFMVLPTGAALTIALWILRTFAFDSFGINPRLAARSPEKQCGKTTLLELLSRLTPKPLLSSNCTPASLFRVIEQCQPTLLIDEMDSFQDASEEMRGILNSGHSRRSAWVMRTTGDDHEPRKFSTWCPMVLASIGKLSDTLEDRSLRIDLQRKKKTDIVESLPRQGKELDVLQAELDVIKGQCMRWVQDNLESIANADAAKLAALSDRANDNWHSLLSVASVVGPDCFKEATRAAVSISSIATDDTTIKTQLLIDIQELFKSRNEDRVSSKDICEALAKMDERPWATWRKGKPLSTNQLARLLKDFGVTSQTLRPKDEPTIKGYYKDHFQEAWGRYCVGGAGEGDLKRNTDTTCMDKGQTPDFQNVTKGVCDVSENGTLANAGAGCDVVTFENPGPGAEHTQPGLFDKPGEVLDLC